MKVKTGTESTRWGHVCSGYRNITGAPEAFAIWGTMSCKQIIIAVVSFAITYPFKMCRIAAPGVKHKMIHHRQAETSQRAPADTCAQIRRRAHSTHTHTHTHTHAHNTDEKYLKH